LLPAALVPAPASAQDKITIGVSLAQDDNPFYIAMLRGIRARAQELGWEVATVSANEDKVKQINGVQDLVARGVKGVLISPIDAVGVNAAYDAAKAANVPIVSVARGSTSPNQTLHVAMDENRSAATSPNGRRRPSAARARWRCCLGQAARRRSAISATATPR
jgi:ribose transport system substrate-binding protein